MKGTKSITERLGAVGHPYQPKNSERRWRGLKRRTIWAYLDGEKLVDVLQAALDNNMTVQQVKDLLVRENPGHKVTFKLE